MYVLLCSREFFVMDFCFWNEIFRDGVFGSCLIFFLVWECDFLVDLEFFVEVEVLLEVDELLILIFDVVVFFMGIFCL